MIKFLNYVTRALFSSYTITVNSRNKLGTAQLIKQRVTRTCSKPVVAQASGRSPWNCICDVDGK